MTFRESIRYMAKTKNALKTIDRMVGQDKELRDLIAEETINVRAARSSLRSRPGRATRVCIWSLIRRICCFSAGAEQAAGMVRAPIAILSPLIPAEGKNPAKNVRHALPNTLITKLAYQQRPEKRQMFDYYALPSQR